MAISYEEASRMTREDYQQADIVEEYCDQRLREGPRQFMPGQVILSYRVVEEILRRYEVVGWSVSWDGQEFSFYPSVERRGEYDSDFGGIRVATNTVSRGGAFVDAVSKTSLPKRDV